jgi:hypothetical protein
MTDHIPDIAQRLWEEDGRCGNLYKSPGTWTNIYESRAVDLLDKITDIRRDNGSN